MKRPVVTALIVVFVALCAVSAMSLDKWVGDHNSTGVATELQGIAGAFPAPITSTMAAPDVISNDGREVTRTWTAAGSVDEACTAWREAYRLWIGSTDIGSVTGNSTPGQSCSLRGFKEGHAATLQVAVYGTAAPQVTLNLKD